MLARDEWDITGGDQGRPRPPLARVTRVPAGRIDECDSLPGGCPPMT